MNGLLVGLHVLHGHLLLLLLLLLEVLVGLDDVVLGDLAQNRELIKKLPLTIEELALLIQLHPKGMNLILLISILDLNGLFDIGFYLLSFLNLNLLCVYYFSQGFSLAVQLLLPHLKHIEGLHNCFD